jgi:hypothetical protein
MDRVQQMEIVQQKALDMFKRKNQDYGDAFAKFGVIGILMRIEDKIQRSLSITKNGVNMVDDEGIRDTLMDLHNYAAMGVMLLDEKKELSEDEKKEIEKRVKLLRMI